jgi:hypothetical protein
MANPSAGTPSGHRIEVVRGRLDEQTSERLVEFWTGHRALDESAARRRLADVVCVLYDDDGEIAGVNSVYAANAPLVGRPFWIYRRFLRPGTGADDEVAMIAAAHEELAPGFAGGVREPLGLCVLVSDRALIEGHREAIWPLTDFTFAGYTDAGAQVRIRYFEGAMI